MSSVNLYLFFCIFMTNFLYILGNSQLLEDQIHNCSDYEGNRPHIWKLSYTLAHYLHPTDPRVTSVQANDALGNSNIFQQQQFNCSFDEPIHWVFNLNPVL